MRKKSIKLLSHLLLMASVGFCAQAFAQLGVGACRDAVKIACGGRYAGTTSGESDSRFDRYSGCRAESEGAVWTGPENIYVLRPGDDTNVSIELREKDQRDLYIFALRDACTPEACTEAHSAGLFFSHDAGDTWYILVDGYKGVTGHYNLTVDCP